MKAIIRPEYYVLPVKHPANCQCSEHESKISCDTPPTLIVPATGAHSSILLTLLARKRAPPAGERPAHAYVVKQPETLPSRAKACLWRWCFQISALIRDRQPFVSPMGVGHARQRPLVEAD